MRPISTLSLLPLLWPSSTPALGSSSQESGHAQSMQAGLELFRDSVASILERRCVECHGGDTVEMSFDLTTRAGLLAGSKTGPAVDLANPDDSWMLLLVKHSEEPAMPHDGTQMPEDEIEALERWIELGAPYDHELIEGAAPRAEARTEDDEPDRDWWAFRPLGRPMRPQTFDKGWGRTDIDAFRWARLRAQGLTPNGPADARTLIRRVTLDLIGVPPTPDEVEAFVAGSGPATYARLVDRLLADPRYGERWSRHWLDIVRWAESHGFEHDYDRPSAYHYRDFVIRALNDDMPYDRFVRWQIAGDELAPDEPLALMATGFLAAGTHSTQITKNQVEKERYDELDDMVSTVGTAMLGVTIGCARCHDHKFDPITTRDYYRMASTFTTTVRHEAEIELDHAGYLERRAAYEASHAELLEARRRVEASHVEPAFEEWMAAYGWRDLEPGWLVLDAEPPTSKGGAVFERQGDGSFLATGPNADFDTYTYRVRLPARRFAGLRIEAMADASFVEGRVGRAGNGNIALSDVRVTETTLGGAAEPIELVRPRATFEQEGLPVAAAIDDDPKSGWALDPEFNRSHAAAFDFARPVDGGAELTIVLSFDTNNHHNIGRPRLALRLANSPEPALDETGLSIGILDAARLAESGSRGDEVLVPLMTWFRTRDPVWIDLNRVVQQHAADAPRPVLEKVLIASEGVPAVRLHTQGGDFLEETHFLRRGDPNQKLDVATQSFPRVLMRDPLGEARWQVPAPEGVTTSWRRRALATWITDVEAGAGNLLARVIVNRIWMHHTGRGIVATPSDFGRQGEAPTDPALLEHLASRLVRDGWSLKGLHREICLSSDYKQSTAFDAQDVATDPENVYGWRFRARRLEAEALRDSMLSVAGILDETQLGAGTLSEDTRRRSIYFTVKRSRPVPMMKLFDAPHGVASIPRRITTTVAPQALYLMNDARVRAWARAFALRARSGAGDTQGTIRAAYALALGREPSPSELNAAGDFLTEQAASYPATYPSGAASLEALTDFCQTLFSLNEFAYLD